MGLILALDFGGTKLTAGVVDAAVYHAHDLIWQAHKRVYSPADGDAQVDLATMAALGRELLAGERATAVGVSFGGPADYHTGVVRLSHHVSGWEDVPLQQRLAELFTAPVRIDNDANTAALGEWRFGAGQGLADLLYITVSTGVGGGWILGGRPYRGHNGMAGEIGHTAVDPNGPVCLCGKRGCVERFASGPYMSADLAEALELSGNEITGQDVAEMAAWGEEAALLILQRGAWALGVGIGNAANLMNPQRVILGGGVTKSGPDWWERVRQTARETVLPQAQFDIVPAALGDDAPLWGAVALMENM
ncbi:MAG: ROK family protein [Anaerolineae bacterium]|nr:ROK family protein [Anaerolineae bacterium]